MSVKQKQLLLLELNEVNFDHVAHYANRGLMPNVARLLEANGVTRTVSEQSYDELEPWIQWVTAHTGLTYAEHRVYRLGDIVKHDLPQIWERLEARGLRVGAISPMNASNRLHDAAFFLPDPWTNTLVIGSRLLQALHKTLQQAVSDNARARITVGSASVLVASFVRFAVPANYRRYITLAMTSRAAPWRRAMFLDLLLADIFVREVQRTHPHFASLFLNAAAHIQHHYMFSAAAYEGPCRNPEWYLPRGVDPVGEIYELYDAIVGSIRKASPDAQIMIATGLHQEPTSELTYYWRLKNHSDFLRKVGIAFERVEPLMSRDFRIVCSDELAAKRAQERLDAAVAEHGTPLFSVDNRGVDLFVMLTHPHEIRPGMRIRVDERTFENFDRDVAFVALKNGRHSGVGYFLDSAISSSALPQEIPLRDLPDRVISALGVERGRRREAA